MKIRAAILWEAGKPLSVEEAELDPPGPGEVLVEVKAAGVCRSDLHPARGDWPARMPLVLGHEGAGIVREAGPNVKSLKPGHSVVFCWTPACGDCIHCRNGRPVLCDRLEQTTYRNRLPSGATRLHARGSNVNHFISTACFAEYAVVAEEGAIRVPSDIPFDVLATLGCAVLTGIGATTNSAKLQKGARVAVIGAGGVGLNVIQGARIAQCEEIVAIDRSEGALKLARQFGATSTEAATAVDVVFDTVGSPETLTRAFNMTRKGGTVVVTGLSRTDSIGSIPLFPLVMQEKKIVGSLYGSGDPKIDIPKLAAWFQQGKLKLRELIARQYTLDQVNDALDALARNEGARGIIV